MVGMLLVVEGQGDVASVPILTRRVLTEVYHRHDVKLAKPQRRGEFNKVKSNFSRYLKIALLEQIPILWVMDCDDGDPVVHQHELEDLLTVEHVTQPVQFVLMVKEYESLFLAEKKAAQSVLKIKDSVTFPANPENIRGAKEWLSKHMGGGYSYKETLHQEKLTAKLELNELRMTSGSYRSFETAVGVLSDSL